MIPSSVLCGSLYVHFFFIKYFFEISFSPFLGSKSIYLKCYLLSFVYDHKLIFVLVSKFPAIHFYCTYIWMYFVMSFINFEFPKDPVVFMMSSINFQFLVLFHDKDIFVSIAFNFFCHRFTSIFDFEIFCFRYY